MSTSLFNPEHDLCIAAEEPNFIPPAAALAFGEQCRWVERFMVAPKGEEEKILPWGWNRYLRDKLLRKGVPSGELPSDEELEFIRKNSRREVAQELLEYLHTECQAGTFGNVPDGMGKMIVSPQYRIIARSMAEIEEFLWQNGKVVLKAPLSGSGKGVRFVTGELMETDKGWCRRIMRMQGSVVVEQRLDIVQEAAMLFEVGKGKGKGKGKAASQVRFRGYSLFYASNGAYKGNLLASNGFIEEQLSRWIPREVLLETREKVERFLQWKLCAGGNGSEVCAGYCGFVGVDQFVYSAGGDLQGRVFYNPAVEINLRMTMGLIARNIYDFHKVEFSLGEGTHCFEPLKGIFPIVDREAGQMINKV